MPAHAPFGSGNPHAPFEPPFHFSAYGARVELPLGALQAASNSDRLILLEVTTIASKAVKIEIIVGGVRVTNNEIPATVAEVREVPFAFIVPAGQTFKLNANAGISAAFMNIMGMD